ncbi:acyltransferase family protein [Collinsella sp. An2]|uniref:acyltransferase family protein n=1 Tax=Collinsella sp. An2 TaxID=1965585 RepID=UPI001EF5EADE|nr:acyltransferase family protein [Collinsella sp. An2]
MSTPFDMNEHDRRVRAARPASEGGTTAPRPAGAASGASVPSAAPGERGTMPHWAAHAATSPQPRHVPAARPASPARTSSEQVSSAQASHAQTAARQAQQAPTPAQTASHPVQRAATPAVGNDAVGVVPLTARTAAGRAAGGRQARPEHAAQPQRVRAAQPQAAARRASSAPAGTRAGATSAAQRPAGPAGPAGPGGSSAVAEAAAPKRPRSRYIPALDGIRTFAVLAVVLYHLNLTWAQGGLLGVTVFFVLSGYLITRLLLGEFQQTGRIDLKSFWMRRVRRLVPAIVTVVVVTCALCTLFNHVMLTKMRPDILPSLLFFNNWWQIIQNVSYFDALGDPSPLTHFWSLAIEEQFYLVWPPVLFLLLHLGIKRRPLRRVVLVLAAVSALAMALLYNPAVDPSRLYYGTDTRVFSLLLGAWLAFIPEGSMHPRELAHVVGLDRILPFLRRDDAAGVAGEAAGLDGAEGNGSPTVAGASIQESVSAKRSPLSRHVVDIIGLVGFIGLALMVVFTNGYTAFQYQGGTLLCSIFTVMLIMAAVQPDGIVARVFSFSPLVWVGKRSYSIYLWHYPLLLLMNPVADVTDTPWWLMIVQVLVVLAAAEFSYRFIETPFRKGAFGKLVSRVRAGQVSVPALIRTRPVPVIAAAIVAAIAVGGLVFVPNTSALSEEGAALLTDGGTAGTATDGAGDAGNAGNEAAQSDGGQQATPATDDTSDTDDGDFPAGSYDIVMVGDSVSLRAVDTFNSTFPHGHIDAAKSRQFSAGIEAYRSYVDQNLAGKVAVFALGTNGLVTDDQIDELMGLVGDKRKAVFVNTRSPQPWVGATNEALGRAADRYSNASVIDWYGYSAGRNDLFDGDGTHLNNQGAREYINLIYNAVKDDLPVHPEDHADDPQPQAAQNAVQKFAQALAAGFATHEVNPKETGSAA